MNLDQDMHNQFESQPPGMSTGAKIAIGCSVTLVAVIALCVGSGYFAYRWVMSEVEVFAEPFVQQGYERTQGQALDLSSPITKPTLLIAQAAILRDGATADLAIAAQAAEIYGTVEGDIAFYGQSLRIHPNAVVKGDIDIHWGQLIQVDGIVEGSLTGTYQTIQIGPNGSVSNMPDSSSPDGGAAAPDDSEPPDPDSAL